MAVPRTKPSMAWFLAKDTASFIARLIIGCLMIASVGWFLRGW